MTNIDWSLGTFEGVRAASARAIAAATAEERLAMLEDLLDLALASGALQRSREAKQREIDALWMP